MEQWFSSKLIAWYQKNKRDLPWRNEQDAYKIWISEIILQQTQVIQGTAYYYRFIEAFPTAEHLANAKQDQVLKLWQGLGYYSRARNLHESAKIILKNYSGKIPSDFEKIIALKGVGDYTASAIASFAFNMPHAVLDGNVYRLLSRLFGIKTPIDSSQAKKEFKELATTLLDLKQPAIYNQAIMEFGSQYCKPVNPDCGACIFRTKCVAYKEGLVKDLPTKEKKIKVKKRYFNFFIIADKSKKVIVEKRAEKDIWQGLYQFPLIETDKAMNLEQLINSKHLENLLPKHFEVKLISKPYKHVLTHQLLFANFFVIKISKLHVSKKKLSTINKLTSLAFPRLIEIFLNTHILEEIF